MQLLDHSRRTGLRALHAAVLASSFRVCRGQLGADGGGASVSGFDWLLTEVDKATSPARSSELWPESAGLAPGGADPTDRLTALVDLARKGDAEAFGQLYDHYAPIVHRFLYYRVGSRPLAEDLTSETFFRALRSVSSFQWQGKDFGAWLITIARNLMTDHYKSSRYRKESVTDKIAQHDSATAGIEDEVLAAMTNAVLLESVRQLPTEQQDCLVLRFLQGMSIAETAKALNRSEGATKQLQLRAVRRLAKALPEGFR